MVQLSTARLYAFPSLKDQEGHCTCAPASGVPRQWPQLTADLTAEEEKATIGHTKMSNPCCASKDSMMNKVKRQAINWQKTEFPGIDKNHAKTKQKQGNTAGEEIQTTNYYK